MKLIIDIDEETYIKANAGILGSFDEIIANGIPYIERPQVTVFAENASKEEIEDFKKELEAVLKIPKGDLISREALKKACSEMVRGSNNSDFIPCPSWNNAMELIDNAPTVPLRLMTVEECAGHTIDYAMGWKACIEWIKKGCAE